MAIEIVMPKLSDTMEEGRILKWLKKEGDIVSKGDVIAEVETDKADMDLEAFHSGILTAILYKEGETVPVGTVIAVLGGEAKAAKPSQGPEPPMQGEVTHGQPAEKRAATEGEEPCCTVTLDEEEEKAEAVPKEMSEPKVKAIDGGRSISPAARRLLEKEGIEAPELTGSGPGGRIVKEDVERFLEQRAEQRRAAPLSPKPAQRETFTPGDEESATELSKMRAAIGRRMTQSKQTIPHFYVTREIDMGEGVHLIDAVNRDRDKEHKVSYNDLVIRACALALKDYPELNAHVTEQGVIIKSDIAIGVVVALKAGLLVPVVKHADTLTVQEISAKVRGLRERVLKRESTPKDLTGGTFTISNMGMFGIDAFSAIINPPQVAILAVAAIRDVPAVKNNTIVPAKMMNVTLSADHRAVDGLIVARFLQRLKELLENPVGILMTES